MPDLATWIVAATEVAAFTSGPDGTLCSINEAATSLLGIHARDVVGAPCHEVLCGRDPYGNLYCGPRCPVRRMACRGERIRRFRLDLGAAESIPLPLWLTVIVVGGSPRTGPSLVHLLEPVLTVRAEAPAEAAVTPSGEPRHDPRDLLSPAESMVLELLGSRVSIDVVAAVLGVGPGEARSVLLGCLRKLEALNSPGDSLLAERLQTGDRGSLT